jgi:hypothetical protein
VPAAYCGLLLVALAAMTQVPVDAWHLQRAHLLAQLENAGNRHLVIVRYGPGHSCIEEWVYNRADIDAASVVWARDMGAHANRELLAYFAERQAWLLEVDAENIRMSPYPSRD